MLTKDCKGRRVKEKRGEDEQNFWASDVQEKRQERSEMGRRGKKMRGNKRTYHSRETPGCVGFGALTGEKMRKKGG